MKYSPADEKRLLTQILTYRDRPLDFVYFAYPWGKAGTPLEHHDGPRTWQREELQAIQAHVLEQRERVRVGKSPLVYKSSAVSGRGPGKSALVSMLAGWFQSTHIGATTIVSANTEDQLRSVTFAEVGKWNAMAMNSHWFVAGGLKVAPAKWFATAVREQLKIDTAYYYVEGKTWSEERPDAFAGPHSNIGMMLVFDEASGIPDNIWPVAEGYLTDPIVDRYWFAFSNGRRNTGRFFQIHHRDRDEWRCRSIDSRTVEGTDRALLQAIVDREGEDSDVARVEVRGMFPKTGDKQFIGRDDVDEAMDRELVEDPGAPLILGVDVARFGSNRSVLYPRQGRDARTLRREVYRGVDTMYLADRVADWILKYNPDAVCVDGAGVGGGVVDRLRSRGFSVHDINAGGRPEDRVRYARRRDEMWGRMKEWLPTGCLPDDGELADDLTGPEYHYDKNGKLELESKADMEKRGLASPDDADALSLTFSVRVARRDLRTGKRRYARQVPGADYRVLG